MRLLFDESLSQKLVDLLRDLFPESKALPNGLAQNGDLRVLEYACSGGFVLVRTDSDSERLFDGPITNDAVDVNSLVHRGS